MHDLSKSGRRRSLSASRTLDSTVNFVGRIGASLRISSRKRAKEKQKWQIIGGHESDGKNATENWLRFGVHYAKVGVERRRSACSAIFTGGKTASKLYFVDEDCAEDLDDQPTKERRDATARTVELETHHHKRYQVRSNSVVTSRDRRLTIFSHHDQNTSEEFIRDNDNSNVHRRMLPSRSNVDFYVPSAETVVDEDEVLSLSPRYSDDNTCDDDKIDEETSYTQQELGEEDDELHNMALVPLPYPGASVSATLHTRSAVSSPLTVDGYNVPLCNPSVAQLARSCPSTPQTPARRRYLHEGSTQLTSLATLCTHNRYLFLFNDLLLISKQKGENSYKLKEKVSLERLWISSNNCTHSFVIGWPIQNFVAHFSTETEKNAWFTRLNNCIKRHQKTASTTISVVVRIEGRQQVIRREVENGARASQLVQELIEVLDLPILDPHLFHYELCIETGATNNNHSKDNNIIQPNNHYNGCDDVSAAAATLNSNVNSNYQLPTTASTSFLTGSPNAQIIAFNGVESVYTILMDHVCKSRLSLSDSQLAHLDTCPLVNVRLVLRKKVANGASVSLMGSRAGSAVGSHSRSSTALNLMNHFRKVLNRADSYKTRIFGRQLEGSMPPQPVLTMIDYLTMHGVNAEGIFRRCPKKSTTQELKNIIDQGHVPDLHQYNVHVTAGLLKEYLRDIPGNLLISANYHLWMEVVGTAEASKQLRTCKNLLRLLPPSHTMLLRCLLRLLRKIAVAIEKSKMGVDALAVCLAPSLIVNPSLRQLDIDTNSVADAHRENALAAYVIHNANELFDEVIDEILVVPSAAMSSENQNFTGSDESITASEEGGAGSVVRFGLHHSIDSGLSDDMASASGIVSRHSTTQTASFSQEPLDGATQSTSVSPDSALFEITTSEASSSLAAVGRNVDEDDSAASIHSEVNWDRQMERNQTIEIEEIACCVSNSRWNASNVDGLENDESDDRTPVLSRENSDVKAQFPNRYQWRSHLSDIIDAPQSPDLLTISSSGRVLRLKSPLASGSGASTTSSEASSQPTRRSAKSSAKPSVISSVDNLRVSDFIISTRNGGKLKKFDAQDAELDKLYAKIGGKAGLNSSLARKISNVSTESRNQLNARKSSVMSNSDAIQVTPRRSALVTKNETLGIANNDAMKRSPQTIGIVKTSLSHRPILNTETAKTQSIKNKNSKTVEIRKLSAANRIPKESHNTHKLKRTNSSSIRPSHEQIDRENLMGIVTKGLKDSSDHSATSSPERRSSACNVKIWQNVQGGGIPKENERPGVPRIARPSDRRPVATATDPAGKGSVFQTHKNNDETVMVSRLLALKPWRPPKRTAEEIVLDKSLEVNWSVSSIRNVFQQQKDDKPAAIDTVYAKFDAT